MGEKKKDEVQLKDIEKGDGDESTEKSPLKEDEDGEAKEVNGIKEDKGNPLMKTLQDPKTRLVLGVAAAVILLIIVASTVVGVIVMGSQGTAEPWTEDTIPRMLRLVPSPNQNKNTIRFRHGKGIEGAVYPNLTQEITNLFEFFDRTNAFSGKRNITNCDYRVSPPVDEKYTCFFDASKIKKECTPDDYYGYQDGNPCIFIQFNHVFNFTPEVYNSKDLEDVSLPERLRGSYTYTGPWIECKGNDVTDVENAGAIRVIGINELPRFAFPYKGHADYMAPFIAIKLEKPKTSIAIGITCRLWARNVIYNQTESGLNDTFVDDQPVPSAILPFNVFID